MGELIPSQVFSLLVELEAFEEELPSSLLSSLQASTFERLGSFALGALWASARVLPSRKSFRTARLHIVRLFAFISLTPLSTAFSLLPFLSLRPLLRFYLCFHLESASVEL